MEPADYKKGALATSVLPYMKRGEISVCLEDTTTNFLEGDAVNQFPLLDKVEEAQLDRCREEVAPSGTYKVMKDNPLWRVGLGVCLRLGELLMHEEIGGPS